MGEIVKNPHNGILLLSQPRETSRIFIQNINIIQSLMVAGAVCVRNVVKNEKYPLKASESPRQQLGKPLCSSPNDKKRHGCRPRSLYGALYLRGCWIKIRCAGWTDGAIIRDMACSTPPVQTDIKLKKARL